MDISSSARTANRDLNIREFEQRSVRLSGMPRVLFIELTENCNLSCTMCRSNGPFDRSRNMEPEMFDAVAAELFPTAEIVDLRGWGESTILKDFPAYVEKTLDYGCRVRLVTNLTVPNEAMWRRLVSTNSLIAVSFDASEPDTFAALRPGAKLDVILRNLDVMVDEAKVSGVGTDGIHLNVVVQPAGIAELTGIVRHAARLGIKVQLNPLSADHEDPANLRFHRAEMAAALGELAEAEGVQVQLNTALDPSWAELDHADKTCTHPWMYCYVNYQGKVGFCDHLIGAPGSQYLLGDLNEASFADIWNGELYQQLRTEHSGGVGALSHRFEECRWCYRNRYIDFDEESYPPYADHRVLLDDVRCAGFVVSDAEPRPRMLPLTVKS